MKIYKAILIAGILFSASLFVNGQTPGLKKLTVTKTDRFDFGSGGTLSITGSPNGSMRIVGTNKNEIEIVAVVEVQAASDADLAKLAAATGFLTDESTMRTGILTVGTFNKFGLKKMPKDFPKTLLGLPFRVDYDLKVPRYCDIEIDGGKGDLEITNVEGSMKINYIEANAKIEVSTGNTSVTIGSGDVEVLLGARGWRARSANIALATGNLNISMPTNISAEIDATILKTGTIENNLPDLKPRDRKVPFTEKSILAKAGAGGVTLKFAVSDGKMKLSPLSARQ